MITTPHIAAANTMKLPSPAVGFKGWIVCLVFLGICFSEHARGQPGPDAPGSPVARVVGIEGSVQVSPPPGSDWITTQTGQALRPFYRLRTGPNSRAAVLWSDRSVVPLGELTEIEVLPPHTPGAEAGLHLWRGILSFFHRDRPGRMRVIAAGATAGIEGTEFVLEVVPVAGGERVALAVIDGRVVLTNELGGLVLTNGTQALVEPGQKPSVTAGFVAENLLQWAFYYPAVLDLRDLPLTREEKTALTESLAAYRSGDLLAALAAYPTNRAAVSEAERVYYAGLLLSVGQAAKAEPLLDEPLAVHSPVRPAAGALRTLIHAVKRWPDPAAATPEASSELLAASYYEQSRAGGQDSLTRALALAEQATQQSPEFSYAWERLAELEFGFGRTADALASLRRSLALAPRNAQALALHGFLLAADNSTSQARKSFDAALAVDPALGNAWLGRGLIRIRQGDRPGGLEDLLVAAAVEPRRALLRSYLGKGWAEDGDFTRAGRELALGQNLDPADPTAWLYSALLKQQQHRLNEAVEDLEHSQSLNENRQLYRSQFLLDQDQAVRSVNLAALYEREGMNRVGLREASRAVSYDYSSASAHQFLSDSYNNLRDPTRFNLRYDDVWLNELLLADLLSPVGGARLSQQLSQHEYSRLFDEDRAGLSSVTEYRSDGQWRELASQYGRFGNTGWALDLDYEHHDGVRPNNDLDRIEWYTTLKQQLSPENSLLVLAKYQDYHSGDNFQYYEPTNARLHFRFDESQTPVALLGFHREWGPGVHTLLLGGWLENDQEFSDLAVHQTILDYDSNGGLQALPLDDWMDVQHRVQLSIGTVEGQQLWESERQLLLLGARWQGGEFDTLSHMTNPQGLLMNVASNVSTTHVVEDFDHTSVYAYDTLKLPGGLRVTAGVAYERMTFPENFRAPPVQPGQEKRERWEPKAGVVWEALPALTFRGAYAKSLGGVSIDDSYVLEPRQLAGFPQAFRTLIPESLTGSVSAPDHEVGYAALDLKLNSHTYVGLQADVLRSTVHRTVGLFEQRLRIPGPDFYGVTTAREHLDYVERTVGLTVNQLIAKEWAVGGLYAFTHSDLDSSFPSLSDLLTSTSSVHADLHRFNVFFLFQHASGFFARADWDGYLQTDSRAWVSDQTVVNVPDEFISQAGLQAGYRFPRQHGDVTLGVLNLGGEDYRLNPVNPHAELPRERVFMARLRWRF